MSLKVVWFRSPVQIFLLVIITINGILTSTSVYPDKIRSNTTTDVNTPSITADLNNEDIFFADASNMSNESTTFNYNETSTTEITTMLPTTITPDPCANVTLDAINVTHRTSDMFKAIIIYNCSIEDQYNFTISTNETSDDNCSVNSNFSNDTKSSTIDVECNNIQNHAGRNWTFTINGISSIHEALIDQTFTITFQPLDLNLTDITYEVNTNLTSVLISVANCLQIADSKYLAVRCNSSDNSTTNTLQNCSYTCPNVEPGFIYNMSVVRLPIPIVDNSSSFEEKNAMIHISIGLDKVTNLNFTCISENRTAIFYLNCPRGSYEKIRIDCNATDQSSSNSSRHLTTDITNCLNNTFISMDKIVLGVSYECHAFTIKTNFSNANSSSTTFKTSLEPVYYSGPNSSNTSFFIFEVSPQSDFDQIVLTCIVTNQQSSSCSNHTTKHQNGSTRLEFIGTPGCDYNCSFTTEKTDYSNATSTNSIFSIYPSKPQIKVIETGSRWISISWTIEEITNIQAFKIMTNTSTKILSRTDFVPTHITFFYNYTNSIEPFRRYGVCVELITNRNISSEYIFTETLEEAPTPPSDTDIDNNLIPQSEDPASTSEQYVIEINSTLFSNDHGIIRKYLIYVRQDQNDNTSTVKYNGSYIDARDNSSIDYLAYYIPINSFEKNDENPMYSPSLEVNTIRLILGNDTQCPDKSPTNNLCNGPLEPDTAYKVIVSGCTNGGCTNVLSRAFTTLNQKPPSPSFVWLFVLLSVALFVAMLAVLARWKRRPLQRLINSKIQKYKRSSGDLRSSSISLPSIYTISPKRPKPLCRYVNMTKEDEKAIYAEYQELDSTAPQYRQSDYESEYAMYNRYANIPARGPWERTAVRLNATHRFHDYINANEIRGLYSDKQYIACQGPLEDTCQDFWEMIIQYNVLKIVMLTRTEERNPHNSSQKLLKCFHYFPENNGNSLTFGRVVVQVTDIEYRTNDDLEIRHILIKDENTEHHVYHYYFTGWPDFSVVDQRKLLDLIETINNHGQNSLTSLRKRKEALLTPIVVHCSAGVGRTGTYIAVDIITRLIEQSKNQISTMELDVMGIVYKLREDRGKMVQTKDQYMLVNRCVEEYLRRTNRLNNILQQTSVYEDPNDQSQISTESIYLEPRTLDSASNEIVSSDKVQSRKKLSSPATNGHIDQPNVTLRQSKYGQTSDDHFRKSVDKIIPSLPPRLSSKESQFSDF